MNISKFGVLLSKGRLMNINSNLYESSIHMVVVVEDGL